MRRDIEEEKPSCGTPYARGTRSNRPTLCLGLTSLADLTGTVYNGKAAGQSGSGASRSADAFGPRTPRAHGFAGEFVGPLVELDSGVPADVDEVRGGPLGQSVAHALDEGNVRFRFPPFRQDA